MGKGLITEFGGTFLRVQGENGESAVYDQDEGLEEPPLINADIMWISEAAKKYEVIYGGDNLPNELFVRDGGAPGYHKYRRRPVD
jgi:hypothetical protein